MRNILYVGITCAGASLAAICCPLPFGQLPVAPGVQKTEAVTPRQPRGILSDELGVYRTIEGFRAEGGKVETGTLLVDTVDGKQLDKPIALVIRGAVVVDRNLQHAVLSLPKKQRCILKGFESGEMIGVPSAVSTAAKEQGWKEVPMSSAGWRWRPYFTALVVVEPKGVELGGPPKTRSDESNIPESRPVSDRVRAKLEALFQKHYPEALYDNQGVNGIQFEYEVTTFEFPYTGLKGAKHESEKQRGPKKGGVLCSVYSSTGPYMGQLALHAADGDVAQHVRDRTKYKQLLMAPYSPESNVHLWVALSFPPDVDAAFLETFRQIMTEFEKAEE